MEIPETWVTLSDRTVVDRFEPARLVVEVGEGVASREESVGTARRFPPQWSFLVRIFRLSDR